MIKIGVSVVLALIIFLLNSIPLPFTQGVIDQVKTVLTEDFDVDEALGKLKFVGDAIPEQIKSVFQQDTQDSDESDKQQRSGTNSGDFASPVRGEIVRSFGEQIVLQDTGKVYANQGIDIKTAENAGVYASAYGLVAAIEEHETYGPSIWLEHGNKVFSFYGRCSGVDVKVGQEVNKGQKLGTVQSPIEGESTMHFQIWIDDKPVDPLKRISQAGQASEGQGV
ncbi:MAG: M23 family metallopeptidase [Clostridiales bacterium]|jgi:murein DD-endopeptidase MepM/ murein hydrolase activator NlpD|nr:M23 family metallopeptidase [Clostridiales bacterium]